MTNMNRRTLQKRTITTYPIPLTIDGFPPPNNPARFSHTLRHGLPVVVSLKEGKADDWPSVALVALRVARNTESPVSAQNKIRVLRVLRYVFLN
jgi:hypothetical protein